MATDSWFKLAKYVTLDHKTSHKVQFFEIEIYTSSESWINKLSVVVRIGQYLAEVQLFVYVLYVGPLANTPRVAQVYALRMTEPQTQSRMWLIFSHFTTQFDWHTPVSPRILYPEDIPSKRPLDTHTHALGLLESVFCLFGDNSVTLF